MHGTAWSLIPFLIVIPISILTRQVIPGLLVGLLVGAYMMSPTPLGGISQALSYLLRELAVPDNLRLIVFLYGFGAFVGLVRVTGGVAGFARYMEARVKTTRSAFAVTWLSSIGTFMAPDFRIITIAPVMKHIFARLKVPTQKVAAAIDVSATPLCAVVPIGTAFVGYMVGLLAASTRHNGIATAPYHLFLQSLPFNFFSWLMIAFGLALSFLVRAKRSPAVESSMVRATEASGEVAESAAIQAPPKGLVRLPAESRLRPAYDFGKVEVGLLDEEARGDKTAETSDDIPDAIEAVASRVRPRAVNLLMPLILLLVLTLLLTWWDGHTQAAGLFAALAKANAAKAMLEALLITLVVSVLWYTVQRQPIDRTMFAIIAGGNEMMGVIVLLVLVWGVSAVSANLGFGTYTEHVIGGLVPAAFIAPVLFLFGCAISYVIGSSFGTWGMLMPLGFSLAQSAHASLPLIAGAVFASGTFGGFVSPLSDNTVAMSTVMKIPLMSYARYKLRLAWPVAAATAVLYAVIGYALPTIA